MALSRLLSLLLLVGASALQLQPLTRVATVGSPLRVSAPPRCQFGQKKPDTEQKGLSRDSEPDEFFSTNMGARTLRMADRRPNSPCFGRLRRRYVGFREAQEPGRNRRCRPDRGALHHRLHRTGCGALMIRLDRIANSLAVERLLSYYK